MKKLINSSLGRFFGVRLVKTSNLQEEPLPFIDRHALRLIYFYDLLCQIEDVEGEIVAGIAGGPKGIEIDGGRSLAVVGGGAGHIAAAIEGDPER